MVSFSYTLRSAMAGLLWLLAFTAAQSQSDPTIQLDSVQQVHCAGGADGEIYTTISNGQPPYLLLWSNGSITDDISGLSAGTYACTVTDFTGSTATLEVTLNDPNYPINPNIGGPGTITCAAPVLTLESVVSDLLTDYTAAWTSANGGHIVGADNALAVNVDAAGLYTLTVTHTGSGCTASDDFTVSVDTLAPIVFAGSDQLLLCSNSAGALNGSVTGGVDLSWYWDATNGGLFSAGGTHSTDLNAGIAHTGTFTLTGINNGNGCSSTDAVVVSSTFTAPALLASASPLTCADDTATLTATYALLNINFGGWTGPGGYSAGNPQAETAVAGNYTVTIADTITGCTNAATATVKYDTLPPVLQIPGNIAQLGCLNPVVTIAVNTDSLLLLKPYSFNWQGPDGFTATGNTIQVNRPGQYTVTVTDNLNGCTTVGVVQVTADPTFVWADAGNDAFIDCYAPTAVLSGSGSSQGAQYSYQWSTTNGIILSDVSSLAVTVGAPGTYHLVVTNSISGCTETDVATVTANLTAPQIAVSANTITCTTATATLTATADTTGLDFGWSGPNGYTATTLVAATNSAGTYTFTASNPLNGCSASADAVVEMDTLAPSFNLTGGNLTCISPVTTLSTNVSGGSPSFAWNGPNGFSATTAQVTVGTAGLYSVTVTEQSNGCQAEDDIQIIADVNFPQAVAGTDDYLNCNVEILKLNGSGSSTGAQFIYLWTTTDGNFVSGETSLSPRVDAAGTYVIAVANTSNGCIATDTVLVIQRPDVTVGLGAVQHVNCFGASTGSVTAIPGGGTGTFTYGWSDGAQTATAANLSAGTYTVVVEDADGCSASASVEILQPGELHTNASATAETFGGLNDGTATVAPTGGVATYSVLWSNGLTSNTITNLAPGNYSVTVTDNNGCTAMETVTVNASNCFITAAIISTNISCFGASDGTAGLTVNNAPNPVSYAWSNNATTANISGLAPGNYTVTVTDGNGCSVVRTTTINTPQALAASIVIEHDVSCMNSTDGYLAASVNGGTQPYTFNWSNGSTIGLNLFLSPGVYTVTVADANGCSSVLTGEIVATDVTPPLLYLQNLIVSLDDQGEVNLVPEDFIQVGFDTECEIETLTLTPNHFDCTQPGLHTISITATDVNGNSVTQTATVQIIDNVYPLLNCPADLTVGLCDAFLTYATPTVSDNCSVNPALLTQTAGLPSGSLFPLGTTLQTFHFTDTYGNIGECNFSVTVVANPEKQENIHPASCGADCDGSVELTITSGAAPFTVKWDNGQTGLSVNGLCPGMHTYSITDGLGCVTIYSFNMGEEDNEAPTLILTLGVAPLDANGMATISPDIFDDGSFDNCGIASWSADQLTFTCAGIGYQNIMVTATDYNGNSVSGLAELAVVDLIPPTLTCPDDIVAGICAPLVVFSLPDFTDNCSNTPATMTLQAGLAPGSVFPMGVTTQVYRATDNSGNSRTCSFTVTVADMPSYSAATNSPNCAGACDGVAVVTPLGGLMPFTYHWSNGQTGNTATGLCAGIVTVTVSDAAGCTQSSSFTLQEPPAINLVLVAQTNDQDNAGVGSIDVDVTGGIGPYTYAWTLNNQPFATTPDLAALHAGTYVLVVTDAHNCTFTQEFVVTNTVDTNEPLWAQNMQISPNPALDHVLIQFGKDAPEELSVAVCDGGGRVIRKEQFSGTGNFLRLDLGDLPAGMWFLHLQSNNGGNAVRKLVVGK